MMTREFVEKNEIVLKYLRGDLSLSEKAEFEIFYLNDPATLDELEAVSALRDHLHQVKPNSPVSNFGFRKIAGVATGAMLATLVLLPFVGDRYTPQANVRTFVIDNNRGAEPSIEIDRLEDENLIVVSVPVAIRADDLSLSLIRDGKTQLIIDNLRSDFLGDVVVALPIAELSDQPTLLSLADSDGKILIENHVVVK